MDISKIPRSVPHYGKLFETLPKRVFLGHIFFNPRFARTYSYFWDINLDNKIKTLSQIFAYFDEDDLYKYFEINHSFHKDKPKFEYAYTLFHLLTDLSKDISTEEFVPLNDVYPCNPIYIFNQSPNVAPEVANMARDILYNGYSIRDVRIMYGYNPEYYKDMLKMVYQEELLPLDITLI